MIVEPAGDDLVRRLNNELTFVPGQLANPSKEIAESWDTVPMST